MLTTLLIALVGIVVGFLGTGPMLLVCRMARKRSYANMAAGLIVIFVSFLFFTVVLFAAYKLIPQQFLLFSLVCMGSFLLAFVTEAVLAYRWMKR